MSTWSRQLLPELRRAAEVLVAHYGLKVTSVYRSPTEQRKLWNTRHNNPYPVAPPGKSFHEHRRAFDAVGPENVLRQAGQTWRSWGGQWFESDPIHFQA
jgi:hypothetical protein